MFIRSDNTLSWRTVVYFVACTLCASFFKLSFILGSYACFFSGSSLIMPLTGAFMPTEGVLGVSLVAFFIKWLIRGTLSLKVLAYHIPGIFASGCWQNRSWLFQVVTPLVCMALFMLHPQGGSVFFYSLYWCIPVMLYYVRSKAVFLTALASTFVAHAVGSVIWIYTVPMTPTQWYLLIPIVAIERCSLAAGMTILYYVSRAALAYIMQPQFVAKIESKNS